MDICWQLIKRVRLPLCIMSFFFATVLFALFWEDVWLLIDTPRLHAQMKRMVARCDSVAVNIHFPYKLPSSKSSAYYVLRGREMANLFAEVIQNSNPAHQRDFASSYFIHIRMYDTAGKPYCFVSVQPSSGMIADTQLKSIIQAAAVGEPQEERSSFPKGSDVEWVHLRKCTK